MTDAPGAAGNHRDALPQIKLVHDLSYQQDYPRSRDPRNRPARMTNAKTRERTAVRPRVRRGVDASGAPADCAGAAPSAAVFRVARVTARGSRDARHPPGNPRPRTHRHRTSRADPRSRSLAGRVHARSRRVSEAAAHDGDDPNRAADVLAPPRTARTDW